MIDPRFNSQSAPILACYFALVLPAATLADETVDAAKPRAARQATSPAGVAMPLEAQCTDGSIVKLALLDERLRLATPYGELLIPVTDVLRIDFSTRIPPEVAARIEAAIARLASAEFESREQASAELFAFQERAYAALVRAQESEDLEVVRRAEQLLGKLRETIGDERLEVREQDVVYTADSKIAGTLVAEALQVRTAQFGEQRLQLAEVRSIAYPGAVEPAAKEVVPDPGTLAEYQGAVGKTISFKVTGVGQGGGGFGRGGGSGAVWGTDVYTLDSTLSVAAVHAGVLRAGQSGIVRVTIVGPQNTFEGSVRNGITTSGWGQYPGGFKFKR